MFKYAVTNEEIEAAFHNTSFGDRDHRKLLQQGVLKINAGYRCGHTLTCIMRELGLIGKTNTTKKGNRFLFWGLEDTKNSG